MTDVATLEEKIKRLRKTLSEIRKKSPETEENPVALRPFRKRLKRLQRRRRVLSAALQREKKAAGEKAEKEEAPTPKSADEPPVPGKEAKAG